MRSCAIPEILKEWSDVFTGDQMSISASCLRSSAALTVSTPALFEHQGWRQHRSGDDDAVQQVQTQQVAQEHEVRLHPDPKLTCAADRIRLIALIVIYSPYNTLVTVTFDLMERVSPRQES